MARKILLLFSSAVCLVIGMSLLRVQPAPQLPVLAEVPNFTLTERSGSQITLSDLKGQVWVADFIFTNCADSCPMMTMKMKKLQEQLKGTSDVRLVSISVDPDRDTPEALKQYADKNGAGKEWLFLTGSEPKIYDLVQRGFMLAIQNANTENPILHSQKFVLVDAEGKIRGYYDSDDPQNQQKLVSDVQLLLKNRG